MQEQGYSTEMQGANKSAREATLNERLNRVGDQMAVQCDRIENVLARVNGTPRQEPAIGTAPTPIRPTQSLVQMVENLEVLCKRLGELRNSIERIA